MDPDDGERTPNEISPINEDPDNLGEPLLPKQPFEDYVDPETLNVPGDGTTEDPRAEPKPTQESMSEILFHDSGYPDAHGVLPAPPYEPGTVWPLNWEAADPPTPPTFALTTTAIDWWHGGYPNTSIQSAAFLLGRIRIHWDGGPALLRVTVNIVYGGSVWQFVNGAYPGHGTAEFNATPKPAMKVLYSIPGAEPDYINDHGRFRWDSYDSLGPIDFNVISSYLPFTPLHEPGVDPETDTYIDLPIQGSIGFIRVRVDLEGKSYFPLPTPEITLS
jgi:hypothetical protein